MKTCDKNVSRLVSSLGKPKVSRCVIGAGSYGVEVRQLSRRHDYHGEIEEIPLPPRSIEKLLLERQHPCQQLNHEDTVHQSVHHNHPGGLYEGVLHSAAIIHLLFKVRIIKQSNQDVSRRK